MYLIIVVADNEPAPEGLFPSSEPASVPPAIAIKTMIKPLEALAWDNSNKNYIICGGSISDKFNGYGFTVGVYVIYT